MNAERQADLRLLCLNLLTLVASLGASYHPINNCLVQLVVRGNAASGK